MRNLKITIILAALVGLLAFAGCGGDDDSTSATSTPTEETTATDTTATDETTEGDSSEYGSELSTILTDFGSSFQDIGADIQGSQNPDDYVGAFEDFESEIDKTISDIEALDTPEEAQQGQDDLVSALQAFGDSIGDFGSELSGGDPEKIQAALTEFQKQATTFQTDAMAALSEIADAGVEVDGSTGLGG